MVYLHLLAKSIRGLKTARGFGLTTLMVSHDVGEVYKLSRRVMVIEQGSFAIQGSPAEVFKAGQGANKSGSSGKFSFAGEVLEIETADVVFAVTLLVGNQVVRVMLMSKAFNPVLQSVMS